MQIPVCEIFWQRFFISWINGAIFYLHDVNFWLSFFGPSFRYNLVTIGVLEFVVVIDMYAQPTREKIKFYRTASDLHASRLMAKAAQVALRDLAPAFILTELIAFLNHEKIVRPGYTTLQEIIRDALSAERARLGALVETALDDQAKAALQQLLVREDTLSELSAIKQDAKHFGYRMMVLERQKRATLEPLYRLAKSVLPRLSISQQNLDYYASLADHYTIYD